MAPFLREGSSHTAMGRYGNVMLVNGETEPRLAARRGEVVRLYLTNTANTRVFRLAIPRARMKLVGADLGRVEREEYRERIMIAPSERWIVDVHFPEAGDIVLEHLSEGTTYRLATFEVSEEAPAVDYSSAFADLRRNPEFAAERSRFAAELARDPDKIIVLQAEMSGMAHHMDDGHDRPPGWSTIPTCAGMENDPDAPATVPHQEETLPLIEWEDTMPEHNAMSTPENMHWYITEVGSGQRNADIHWVFERGDRVKVRIVNDAQSDHPMQHPIHFHGQRFYALRWEDHRSANLHWKDTVLVPMGQTVDILLDCSNPGSWMVHCHIAEHLEAGMMFTFEVRDTPEAYAADLRKTG